jgi:hypothetical protein
MKIFFTILVTCLSAMILSVAFDISMFASIAFAFGLSLVSFARAGVAFETISANMARGVYTNAVVAVFREQVMPTAFFGSFFRRTSSKTKYVSIEVKRGTEKIAVDVIRGAIGKMNKSTRSTEKQILPPLYSEYFNLNELDVYDRAIGGNAEDIANLSSESAAMLTNMRNKIERSIELQCSQIMLTGIVQLKSGDNIDFKRKAGSLVDLGAGNYWVTGTVNPYTTLTDGANFIRTNGKYSGSNYNIIMGADALEDFMTNTIVKGRNDIVNWKLDNISSPLKNGDGTYHGRVSFGSYTGDIWTYTGQYEDANGVTQKYMDAKSVIMLPETTPEFLITFGLVPQLINGQTPQVGEYLLAEYIDERGQNHEQHIKSAPVAIPVAIDTIYTVQVKA